MTTRTQSRVARPVARLRQLWAELDDAQRRMTEIRNPRIPSVESQRHGSSATLSTNG